MANLNLKISNEQKHIDSAHAINERYSNTQKQKLAKAAKQFESLLTSMMLKSMTNSADGMFGKDSYGGDYFSMIFDNQLASYMSDSKSMGIAGMLYKKITGEDLNNLSSGSTSNPLSGFGKPNKPAVSGGSAVTPSSASMNRLGKYDSIIADASEKFGIDPNVIKSVILTESAANEKAVSGAKAKGLMQLIDSTAHDMGVQNVWDPKQNILGGTKYLAEMLRKYNGNLRLALASYNAGPSNVDKYNGIPPFEETQNYVTRVFGYLKHLNGESYGND
jgi:Rod binding domain-containing protein